MDNNPLRVTTSKVVVASFQPGEAPEFTDFQRGWAFPYVPWLLSLIIPMKASCFQGHQGISNSSIQLPSSTLSW